MSDNSRLSLWDCRDLFTDISLVCSSSGTRQIIRAHKVILVASSSFFKNALSLQPRDEIELLDTDFQVLQNVINFMYSGQTPNSEQEVEEFLKLGKALSVKSLPVSWTKNLKTDSPPIATEDTNLKRKRGQDQAGDASHESASKLLRRVEDTAEASADRDEYF